MATKDYTIFIPPVSFESFMGGKPIEQRVYYRWKLKIGDNISWMFHDSRGSALVVSYRESVSGPIYTFKRTT